MPPKKKILIITYYWPPCGGAGVQRWLKFTKYMPQFGWEPYVLTVDPDYAEYPVIDTDLLDDVHPDLCVFYTKAPKKIFQLYKKITGKKILPYGGFSNENKAGFIDKVIRFVRGNFFLPDPRRGWNRELIKKSEEIIETKGIKIVITTSPPHSTQLAGMKLKKKRDITWIADIRDPWTDIYYNVKLNQTFWASMINKKMETRVLRTADKIMVTCNATEELFRSKLPGNEINDKILTLTNGYDEEDFNVEDIKIPERFTITYLGTFADNYNIDILLDIIEKQIPVNGSGIDIRFIGGISKSTADKLNNNWNISFEFIQYLNHNDAVKSLMESSALLLVIPVSNKTREMIPGKLFEYLAARRPIIALGPKTSDVADILNHTNSGKIFNNNDAQTLSEYIRHLIINFQKGEIKVRSTGIQQYSRKNLSFRLTSILNELK
ncbi:MAG: glycosyltransferase family 4 protein [Bacteroidota bacterium]|nr:glycosyltransferase family 4 protein [Bacteroidota bacterium]